MSHFLFLLQAVSIVEGKKSVDVGVKLCYCNQDLCNVDVGGGHGLVPGVVEVTLSLLLVMWVG